MSFHAYTRWGRKNRQGKHERAAHKSDIRGVCVGFHVEVQEASTAGKHDKDGCGKYKRGFGAHENGPSLQSAGDAVVKPRHCPLAKGKETNRHLVKDQKRTINIKEYVAKCATEIYLVIKKHRSTPQTRQLASDAPLTPLQFQALDRTPITKGLG